MTYRIEPTPEDLEIMKRHIARLTRLALAARPARYNARTAKRLVEVVKNGLADYIEFPKKDSTP